MHSLSHTQANTQLQTNAMNTFVLIQTTEKHTHKSTHTEKHTHKRTHTQRNTHIKAHTH